MAMYIWINIGSGYGVLLEGTEPLIESIRQINKDMLWHLRAPADVVQASTGDIDRTSPALNDKHFVRRT